MSDVTQADTIQYTECYLAFLDILGMKKLVQDSSKAASLVGLINSLAAHETREADPWRSMIFSRRDPVTDEIRTWTLQVRPFSDSIVLFVPTESQGLSWLLGKVRYLHDSVLSLGYAMRGAVVIGGMYWDDSWSNLSETSRRESPQVGYITVGPAIVEAYLLENEKAMYPRIIFSGGLVAHIEGLGNVAPDHSLSMNGERAFPLTSGSPATSHLTLRDFMQEDEDGMHSLHVLSEHMHRQGEGRAVVETSTADGKRSIIYQHDPVSHEAWMRRVHDFLESKLEEHKGQGPYAKYRWFAKYYNRSRGSLALPELEVEEDCL